MVAKLGEQGDRAGLVDAWQAAAETGGTTRSCCPTDSLI